MNVILMECNKINNKKQMASNLQTASLRHPGSYADSVPVRSVRRRDWYISNQNLEKEWSPFEHGGRLTPPQIFRQRADTGFPLTEVPTATALPFGFGGWRGYGYGWPCKNGALIGNEWFHLSLFAPSTCHWNVPLVGDEPKNYSESFMEEKQQNSSTGIFS